MGTWILHLNFRPVTSFPLRATSFSTKGPGCCLPGPHDVFGIEGAPQPKYQPAQQRTKRAAPQHAAPSGINFNFVALRGGRQVRLPAALGSGHTTGRSAATAVCCREMTVYVVRIIIRHSWWNMPDSFLRVTGCGVRLPCFLPRLGPAAGAAGPFLYLQRERIRSPKGTLWPRTSGTLDVAI
jgi:hypothetical protein